ncbi:MAG: FAD-dependent monooxygenase [Burkholderiales bacterium]
MDVDTDIAIVGGGPVGSALALALRESDLRITVLEARPERVAPAAHAPRPIALSHGSRLLLERVGAWAGLRASKTTAINHIHVSQRGGFGRMAISAADAGVPHLGYVSDYDDIFSELANAVRSADGDFREGAYVTALRRDGDRQYIDYTRDDKATTLTARLAVIADGGDIEGLSPPKVIDYAQHALTACVSTALPHENVAYERFTPEGPLALLPFGDIMALVWTLTPSRAEALKDAEPHLFLAALRESFGGRLGDFKTVTQRACYPLSLRYATGVNKPGVVTIGNAAQTLHPVAGQGFNLGLRDAWELAQLFRTVSPQALTNRETNEHLRGYLARRRIDRNGTIAATHGLVRLFSNDFFPANVARGAGMTMLGCVAPLKNFVARRMIFGARG